MSYSLGFILSLVTFAIGLAVFFLAIWKRRLFKRLKPLPTLVVMAFISESILFYPMIRDSFEAGAIGALTTVLASAHTALRLFVIDCDFEFVLGFTASIGVILGRCYRIWCFILFILSPMLAAGTLISFVANLSAYNRFLSCFFKDTYVFSELNERSLTLAKSLKASKPSRAIIFTDVFAKNDEASFELIEQAKNLDAILFKNDITAVNFRFHYRNTKLYFFVIGSDEDENVNQTVCLCSKDNRKLRLRGERKGYDYPRGERGDTRVYHFSTNFSSELQLSAVAPDHLKLRRVNDVQSLIYKMLDDCGMQIFRSANETGNAVFNPITNTADAEKKISAVIVGLGLHGTEMLKALTWVGQMHPYKIEINAFDKSSYAASNFMSGYPELFDRDPLLEPSDVSPDGKKYHNGDFDTPGEAHYKITIHPKTDVRFCDFDREISKIKDASYVFVATGNDDLNIKIATKIRVLLRRVGCMPVIHTVIYNPNKKNIFPSVPLDSPDNEDLCEIVPAKNNVYQITPFGDISTAYSEDCILNSKLEELALERHMKYTHKCIANKKLEGKEKEDELRAGEESFWKIDYNYRSSVASVIHTKFKKKCNAPAANKLPADRSTVEKYFYNDMEHRRWNAYVRSEGRVFAPSRDDLAKTHNLLIPFDQLPDSQKIKDED